MLSKPRIPLIFILLSSSHASLLDNADKSIGSHLSAAFPKVTTEHHIDILAAVVDSIPPGPFHRPHHPRCDGLEGVCIAYLDSDEAAPNLWSHRQTSMERDTMTIQQRCSLTFSIRNINAPQIVRKIQLPVANTLFLNGKPSTLIAQRWVQQSDEATQSPTFTLTEQRSLPEQTINMTVVPPSGFRTAQNLPNHLKPITSPRAVVACVGNIVQQVSSSDDSKVVPASQELEETIQQGINDGRMPKQSQDVWALIAPRGTTTFRKVNLALLQKGFRLHKVLSGGGGWGVKQGLLSLDPDSRYKSTLEEFDQESFAAFENDSKDEGHIFGNVVRPGNTITFLVNELNSRFSSVSSASLPDNESAPNAERYVHPFLHFGTIPSTMDTNRAIQASPEVEEVVPNTKTQEEAGESVRVPNFFGALSETGMSFEVSLHYQSPPLDRI